MSLAPLLQAPWLIGVHALAALIALALGTMQLLLPKGSSRHRVMGYAWVALMALVALSSFDIHTIRQLGPFSLIHVLSVYVAVMLPVAVLAARRHRVRAHAGAMVGLFVGGLLIAGAFTLVPGRRMHDVVWPHAAR